MPNAKQQFLGNMVPSTSPISTMRTQQRNLAAFKALPTVQKPGQQSLLAGAQSTMPTAAPTTGATNPRDAFIANAQMPQRGPSGAPPGTEAQMPQTPQNSGSPVNPNYAMQGAGLGATPPGSTPDSQAAYRAAFDAYMRSMQPSAAEQDAQKYLLSLINTSAREELEAKNRGETLGFARGEAANVRANRALDIDAATGAYNALLGLRTANTDANKARVEFEKGLLPEAKDNKPFVVGEGSTVFDPVTGKPVYTAPKTYQPGGGTDMQALLSVTEAQALGVPYGTTRGQALGMGVTGKPNAEQSKARQFAVAAEQADAILNSVGYDPGLVESGLVPNAFKGEGRQQFEQASRAFVNATLRRESGATITDDEFKNKYKELIPQAGDGAMVKEQKRLARAAAVASIRAAGGTELGNMPSLGGGDDEYSTYLQSINGQ